MPDRADLHAKAVRQAFVWNTLNFGLSQVASAAIFFVLASQLGPEVFGAFALALLLTEVLTLQGRSALTDALVQRQDWRPQALATAFTLGLLAALAALAAFAAAAGPLAAALDAPALAALLPALALGALAAPAIAVMEALVLRDLAFRTLALRNMAGVLVGGAAGLGVVYSPAPEWALAVQRLTITAVSLAFLWAQTRWRPGLALEPAGLAAFARAAAPLWAAQALAVAPARAAEAIVAAIIGPAALGLMRVAGKFTEVLHGPVTGAIMPLWLPILSRLRAEPGAAQAFFLRLTGLSALLAVPSFMGLGAVGPELEALFLSEAFAGAGAVLFFLGFAGVFIPFSFFRNSVLAAMGRNRLSVGLSLLDLTATGIVALAAAPFGLLATLGALLAAGAPLNAASMLAVSRALGVPARAYLAAVAPAYVAAAAMLAAVYAARPLLAPAPDWARLLALAALGAAVYGGALWWGFRGWLLRTLAVLGTRAQAPAPAQALL